MAQHRSLLIIAALLCVITASDASAKKTIGISAGINRSTVEYDEPLFSARGTDWRTGFSGGIFVDWEISPTISLVSELRYSRHVGRVVLDPAFATGYFDIRHGIISVPLSVRLRPAADFPVFLECGPDVGYIAAASFGNNFQGLSGTYTDSRSILDYMDPFSVGLCMGVGMSFERGGPPVAVRLRYTHGLTGVASAKDWYSDWKLRTFGLDVSYAF